MARVQPDPEAEGPGPEDSARDTEIEEGPRLASDEAPTSHSNSASDSDQALAEMPEILPQRDGPHRRSRVDSLESVDEDALPFRSRRSMLKTYEQLRDMHPEKGHRGGPSSIEQKGGLARSISADLGKYAGKLSTATMIRLQQQRQRGLRPGAESWKTWIEKMPFVMDARRYKREYLGSDVAAGLTEGIVCIPMGMSYALLANLPPVYGLYTSLIPPIMYLFLGTCDTLSLGVSAIESLLTAAGVAQVIGWINDEVDENTTQEDIDTKVKVTIAFTLCVGMWQVVMRLFGVGAIATFLSDPVLSGFSSASAFLIGTSQLKHLVGYDLPRASLPEIWYAAVTSVSHFNMIAVLVGVSGILLLWLLKRANQRFVPNLPLPSQVIVVIIATVVTYLFDWEHTADLKVLGDIPSGLPPLVLPSFPTVDGVGSISDYGGNLVLQSMIVALMTYIITISIGKTFARMNQNKYKINGDQELVAMSSANLIGCLFQTYPASGSLSRTAVVQAIPCKTRMHTIPAVFVVMLVLVAITPLLHTLPKSILASVVMFGVVKMIDFRDARRLYHMSKPDFALWSVSFWVTFLVGPMEGIGVSVAVSLLYLLMQQSRPANSTLGRLPGTREYRNVRRFPQAKEIPGIRIFRFDSSLHFANKDFFEKKLKALEEEPYCGVPVHTIVLDASSINQLDASAIDMLILVAKGFKERGVSMLCANWKGPQRDLLELSGFYDVIPPANLFLGLHDAVVEARKRSRERETYARAPPVPPSVVPDEVRGQSATRQRETELVVEIGQGGETRQWRVGTVMTDGEGVEQEWGLERV